MVKPAAQRMTVPRFSALKAAGQKITMLTAYDYSMAALLDATGIEAILVGDSMSMVVQGHPNTLPVTLDEMIYHAEMVGRAVQQALVVVDMPFPSYHLGVLKAIENAGRILKETRCQAVKLEGGADQADVIRGLVSAGIPVMAHVGLRPQSVHALGGYKVQRDEAKLMNDARAAEEAGAFAIVLECIPAELAAKDHEDAENSDDRHRRRRRLRWPGAGDQRSAGHHQRLCAEIREGLCRFESDHRRRGDPLPR